MEDLRNFGLLVLVVLVVPILLVGCVPNMSEETKQRVDSLKKENDLLIAELKDVQAKIKDGTLTSAEAYIAANRIQNLIDRNVDEIKDISKQEGYGGWEIAGLVLLSLFGRSPLHKISDRIPVLGGLLGQSAKRKA